MEYKILEEKTVFDDHYKIIEAKVTYETFENKEITTRRLAFERGFRSDPFGQYQFTKPALNQSIPISHLQT